MQRSLSTIAACMLALALAGCGKSEQPAATADGSGAAVAPTSVPAAATPASAATSLERFGDSERAFIAEATGDNAFQIALGRMALEKSSSAQMHALAQRLVEDHTRMANELAAIVGSGGADQTSPAMPADKALQLRNHLSPLQGEAFRKAFVDVTIHEHHLAVALFANEAKNGYDKALRNFARKELPALREQLSMAQAMLEPAGPSSAKS